MAIPEMTLSGWSEFILKCLGACPEDSYLPEDTADSLKRPAPQLPARPLTPEHIAMNTLLG
jgi:hypothetical protein